LRIAGLAIEQVGSTAVVGVTAHVRTTFPVNPATGVTVIVEVPLLPAVVVMAPLLLSKKPCVPPFEIVTVANEGWYVVLPEYCTVITFEPP
jgi:hypothetical protein